MQVVAGVEVGTQPLGIIRIARGGLEIHYGVEGSAGADPSIERLPDRFSFLSCIIGALVRRQGAANRVYPMSMRPLDELLKCANQFVRRYWLGISASDIVDAFEHDDPLHA